MDESVKIIVGLISGVVFGVVSGFIAAGKSRSVVGWFIIGFLLGPLGVLFILLSSDLKLERAARRQKLQRKRMPARTRGGAAPAPYPVTDTTSSDDDPAAALAELTGPASATSVEVAAHPTTAQAETESTPRQWYYEQQGEAVGPISDKQLIAMLRDGTLSATTLLWTETIDKWLPAKRIRALKRYVT